jgi:hypothetical protein
MNYNTEQPKLIISEYGRNIQKMIDHAVSLENREERNKAAQAIIQIMGQLNPHLRDVTDFKHKLWDHLFIISDFKLDVASPYPIPSRETFDTKPDKLTYPSNDIRYRHYGKLIDGIIAKARVMEEGDMRNALVETLANLMKRSYLNWNRDSVNDEVILKHLTELSKGELKLNDTFRLNSTTDLLHRSNKTGSSLAKSKNTGKHPSHGHSSQNSGRNNNNGKHNNNNNNRNFKKK